MPTSRSLELVDTRLESERHSGQSIQSFQSLHSIRSFQSLLSLHSFHLLRGAVSSNVQNTPEKTYSRHVAQAHAWLHVSGRGLRCCLPHCPSDLLLRLQALSAPGPQSCQRAARARVAESRTPAARYTTRHAHAHFLTGKHNENKRELKNCRAPRIGRHTDPNERAPARYCIPQGLTKRSTSRQIQRAYEHESVTRDGNPTTDPAPAPAHLQASHAHA